MNDEIGPDGGCLAATVSPKRRNRVGRCQQPSSVENEAAAEARRGQDIRVTVKMTLAEVATGVKRTIKLDL